MAKVTIGEVEYFIPELNFIALERAWPYVEVAMTSLNPLVAVGAGIRIIAAGILAREEELPLFEMFKINIAEHIKPGLDRDEQIFDLINAFLKKALKSSQIGNVRLAVQTITEEAGLVPEEGEGSKAQVENPGTAISDPSSPNLLQPDTREDPGTV